MSTTLVTGNYVVAADPSTLVILNGGSPAYSLQGAYSTTVNLTFDRNVEVDLTLANASVAAIGDNGYVFSGTVTIDASRTLTVDASGSNDVGYGYYSPGGAAVLDNEGTLLIEATAQAVGVEAAGGSASFTNNGVVTVSSASLATGFSAINGGTYANSGQITVSGLTAVGFDASLYSTLNLTNSGVVNVTALSGGTSVGISVGSAYGEAVTVDNSGQITAQTAIEVTAAGASAIIDLTNSGTIIGDILLGPGPGSTRPTAAGSQIHNAGNVVGALHLDAYGDDLYDGRGGTLSGPLYLGAGLDAVYLGDEGETVVGGAGTAIVTGGAGADTITGGGGNDVLNGGGGNDVITGGAGADTFVVSSTNGSLTIADFSHGQGDKLDLTQLGLFGTFADVMAAASQQGSATVISLGAGQTITLQNVLASSLVAADVTLGGVSVNGDLILPAGQTARFSAGAAYTFTDLPLTESSLTIQGTADISSAQASAVGAGVTDTGFVEGDLATLHIASGGTLSVHMTGTGSSSTGYLSGAAATVAPSIVNDGVIDVEAVQQAVGLRLAGWAYFANGTGPSSFTNNGVFEVVGDIALGVTGPVLAGAPAGALVTHGINNLGTFTVTGGSSAIGISTGYSDSVNTGPITNSGAITVTASHGSAIGIELTPQGYSSLDNSGTITAKTAILVDLSSYGLGNIGITNSGTINGDIVLKGYYDGITNTGTVNGAITLGHADTLDSHSGTINGTITVAPLGNLYGATTTTVILGVEDNTVLFGTQDTPGRAGVYVVDGGGGSNTASFAGANGGVTVSLADSGQAQTVGASTDTLTHFQSLIGTDYDDTLTAAATGSSTLAGGGGGDIFRDLSGSANVTIADFSHAQGDRIDLMALSQFHALSDVLAAATQQGGDTVINAGSGSLTLKNVQASDLTNSDFILGVVPGTGLKINVTYDASTSSAPAGFFTAVQQAVQFFESAFGTHATLNIDIGWGEVDGQALSSGAVAQSIHSTDTLSYDTVKTDLANADAGSAAALAGIASLPATFGSNPSFVVATAEEKAWGLSPSAAVDGYVGLSSSTTFAFDPAARAVPGAYDAIGALEHEISEVLGRVVLAGAGQQYSPLDLFRYSGRYFHDFQSGFANFSLDGTQLLQTFNGNLNGDAGDWAPGDPTDAFNATGQTGVETDVSMTDLDVLQGLGYALGSFVVPPGAGATPPPPSPPPPPSTTIVGTSTNDFTAIFEGAYRQYMVGQGGTSVTGGPENANDALSGIDRIQFVDGFLATSPTDTAGQVYRVYGATLNRVPDPEGLANWVHALNGGTSLQTVVDGFVGSQEFQADYGALDNTQFVTLLYQNVLHRAPDSSGLANWVNALNTGQDTRAQVVLGFSESQEDISNSTAAVQQGLWIQDAAAAQAARLYDTVFGRLPDEGGLANWTHSLETGTSLQTAAADFVASQEFQTKYGTLGNNAFLNLLYQNVLHRAPDTDGMNNWLNTLASGTSRAQVVLDFSESQEHVADTAPHIDNGIWLAV